MFVLLDAFFLADQVPLLFDGSLFKQLSHWRYCCYYLFLCVLIVIIACICSSNVQSVALSTGGGDVTYFISKIAGKGGRTLTVNVPALEAVFGSVTDLAQSKNGDLYVTANGDSLPESQHNVVLKLAFNKQEGTWSNVTIIAGKRGPTGKGDDDVVGTESALNYPNGISLIEDGSTGEVTAILIADWGNHRIRKLDMSTRIITTIAGTSIQGSTGDDGPATDAQLKFPRRVYYDKSNGDIYIVDSRNNRIRRVRSGTISTVVGKTCTGSDGLGDGGQATDACLNEPYYFTINDAGEWLIVDYGNNRVRKVDLHGIISTVVGGGTETGDALATSVKLSSPSSISLTSSGELLVAEYGKSVVRKVDDSGFMRVIAGGGSKAPSNNPIPVKTAIFKSLVVSYARDGSDAIFIGEDRCYIYMLSHQTKCYGVWSDNSAVCSGHGSCIGTDQCQCDDGWLESILYSKYRPMFWYLQR